MKWHPMSDFEHDHSLGEPQGWNDEEVPTEEYIKTVDLDRELREIPHRMRKRLMAERIQMILRTTICFKDIGKFTDNSKDKSLYGNHYSGNHVAIFECQLKAPPPLALIDHTRDSFFDAYRINFRNWRIVDVDNFMQGNTFFDKQQEPSVMEDRMVKYYGEKGLGGDGDDRENDPNFFENNVMPVLEKKFEQVQYLDTKANRNMSPLHKMRAEMLKKKAEAEAEASKQPKKKKNKEKVEVESGEKVAEAAAAV